MSIGKTKNIFFMSVKILIKHFSLIKILVTYSYNIYSTYNNAHLLLFN